MRVDQRAPGILPRLCALAVSFGVVLAACSPVVGHRNDGEPIDTLDSGRSPTAQGAATTVSGAGGNGVAATSGNRDGGLPAAAGAGGGAPVPAAVNPGPSEHRRIKLTPSRGFYAAPITVTITADEPGGTIRYTTNGQRPSPTVGNVYMGPIQVRETTALRAAVFSKEGAVASYSDAATYLFPGDVIRQSADKKPPPGWPASWGRNKVDYGMDPRVVDDPRHAGTIKRDLQSIPTLALIVELADLFDPIKGIYANADKRGELWERPASLELIHSDGTSGYQINAGIRIRGGFSRSRDNPKHAFRIYFKKAYGAGKLKYPMFKGPLAEYDNFDLRCAQNYSWSFDGDTRGIFVRDQFARDNQLAMGGSGERGDFYHLYINGVYWGLYNSAERPGARYAAAYWGGMELDYDVIKVAPYMDYSIYATDGDMMSWNRLYNVLRAGAGDDAMFWRLQGRNLQGAADAALENLVDMDSLIDYQMLAGWNGNFDAPVSRPLGDMKPNNIYMIRNRTAGKAGYRFIAHDSEHTMKLAEIMINRLGPFPAGEMDIKKSSSQNIFQKLFASPEFKLRFADRFHRHFFNDGAMTLRKLLARYDARIKEIDRAVVLESARWGDAKLPMQRPLTRDDNWLPEVTKVREQWIMRRTEIYFPQVQTRGLWPTTAPAKLVPHGGDVAKGTRIMIDVPAGAMALYTTDGSDPRTVGGANAPQAHAWGGAGLTVSADTTIKARAKIGDVWSALTEATFKVK